MYYLLETDYFAKPEPYRTRATNAPFGYAPSKWLRGRTMKPLQEALRIELWSRGGTGLAELFLDSIPLFRVDLIAPLVEADVNNIQAFPAELHPPSGAPVLDYQAV